MRFVRSPWLALWALRCPRCHTGPLFTHSGINLRRFDEMPPACPVCQQTYEPEPGFYYGAMYISSGFSTAILLTVGFLLYYFAHDPELLVYIVAVTGTVLLATPLLFRYSRAMMLYAFGGTRFDARYSQNRR